ncbi:HECT-type E3 ubiquitin transferase [Malassezia obtusa]|uniref:HECT-type E3 ubiquitin transferase n=1 Tax=Malassezia obtusa TaxID=76774 RepID=A0AAF0IS48_9BASI|nr:HECT-type E3 ubiquitin transferase [Malassezia obtusa]
MKITKTPKRRPDVPPAVAALCARIMEADDAALPSVLLGVDVWPWPRGDLYTWVAVLNRFDTLLEHACAAHALRPVQSRPFDAATRQMLLAVLHFSRLLLENCMNRKLYASYEHLDALLGTSDDAVLEAVLRLLLRPAQQHSGTSNPRHELPVSRTRLAVLAAVWPLRDAGVDLVDAARDVPVAAPAAASMHYYRRATSAGPATPGGPEAPAEGLARVDVPLAHETRAPADVLAGLAERHDMSDDEQFELFQRIRLGLAARSADARRAALVARLLAVACVAHTAPESVANARVFAAEPSLVQKLVALLDAPVDDGVQGAALYALDGVSHYRARLQEVLAALNASVSHGTLLEVLRRTTARLADGAAPTPALDTLVDALMTLVAYLTTTVSGSSLVVGAGLIPRLLALAQLEAPVFLVQRTASRAVGLLDSVLYAYAPAFQQFLEAHGIDVLVACVAREVEYGRAHAGARADEEASAYGTLPFGRVTLLRNVLKLFLHLMTTPGTAEGLRNLIDTSLLASLRGVMEAPRAFGPLVLAQAVHIMATFVHNEPTLLATVQEQHLPEAFVAVVDADLAPNFELVSAMTTAVGALCLNAQGLALLTNRDVVPRLLAVLDSERHQKMLLDRDNANVLGAAMDELVRHHPSLKDVMQARIVAALDHTLHAAEQYTPPEDPAARSQYVLLPVDGAEGAPPLETHPTARVEDTGLDASDTLLAEPSARDTNAVVGAFDVQCRFLEGLFRNPAHARDFLDGGGLPRLLRFYGTPCLVYNFAATTPADSFVTLLRVLADVRADAVLDALLHAVHTSLAAHAVPDTPDAPGLVPLLAPRAGEVGAANERFRALVALNARTHLLADLCQTFAYAGQRLPQQLLQSLTRADGDVSIAQLAAAHRRLAYENLLVKAAAAPLPRAQAPDDDAPPLARNVRAVAYVASQLPVSLYTILGETVRMLAPRRTLDATYRAAAASAARALGSAFATALDVPPGASEPNALAALTHGLHVLHGMLLEERAGTTQVHTLVLTALDDAGGLRALLARLDALRAPLAADRDREAPSGVGSLAAAALRTGLELLVRLAQARALLESPHTAQLVQRDAQGAAWEPHAFLVRVRTDVLTLAQTLWAEPWLDTLPLATLRALVQTLLVVLKADAESPPKREADTPGAAPPHALLSSLASLAGRPPAPLRRAVPTADPARVAQLVEMGFARGAARRALERTHNNVSAATEYVLQHPELEDEPDEMETEGGADAQGQDGRPEGERPEGERAEEPSEGPAPGEGPGPSEGPGAGPAPGEMPGLPGLPGLSFVPAPDAGGLFGAGDSPLAPLLGLARGAPRESPGEAPAASPAPPSPAKLELDAQRAAFKPQVLARTLQLAETHEPLVFDAKLVFLLLAESEPVAGLWAQVLGPLRAQDAGESGAHRTAVLLHFAVLLLSTSQVQSQLPLDELRPLWELSAGLVEAQQAAGLAPPADGDGAQHPPWFTPALLALCAVLALCERPTDAQLDQPPTPLMPAEQAALLHAARERGVALALWALEAHAALAQDALLAVYRLLVLATRAAPTAARLGERIPALFAPLARAERVPEGAHRLAVMALRHVVEYAGIVANVMDREIYAWVTNHVRARSSESSSFSKGMAYAVERDLDVFMASAERQVEILDFHEPKAQAYLRLSEHAVRGSELGGERTSDAVVGYLLDTLLADGAAPSDAFRFFVLQTLTELVSSYMVCKQSFLRYQHDDKGRAALVPFLTQLVPAGFLRSYEGAELRTRMAESNWAMSVLVALAADPCASSDAKSVAEPLIVVRKTLLDALCRALRDASAASEPVELRYGRLYALADLCQRLLTAQPNAPSAGGGAPPKLHTEVALHMAKTMLEKNYVTVLTSALADVDLNMPTVKALLEGLLRPLEHLTKVAMKMGKASARARSVASEHPSESYSESMDDAEDDEEDDEDEVLDSDASDGENAPDFYRNSSLGMHTGEMEQGLEDEGLSDDEMDEDEDIEMDEYDSQHSELSTDEEGLDGDSAHVVEVMDEDEAGDDEDADDDASELEDDYESDEFEVDDDGMLPEHDYDYVLDDEDEAGEPAPGGGEDVGNLLEALDGMETAGVEGDDGDLAVDDDERDDDDDDDDDLYDHGELSRLEIADDAGWPMPGHDDRFGANWHWMQHGRRGTRELPPTFFPRADGGGGHPLLVDHSAQDERTRGARGTRSGAPLPEWQRNVEALVGGGTMQVLEMLLNRAAPPGTDTSIRIELADGGRGAPPRMQITNLGLDGAPPARRGGASATVSGEDEAASQAYRFAPLSTSARWAEESRLVHGALATEHALYVRNHLINELLPAYRTRRAAEADARRREEEARRAREEELARTRELQAHTEQQLADSRRALHALEAPEGGAPEPRAPRVTVMVHGEPVDLTDTGIDPTFLEALPDELREEALLSQQLARRPAEPLGLAPDFLDALPASLRSEMAAHDGGAERAPPEAPRDAPEAQRDAPDAHEARDAPPAPAPAPAPRDAIQLLDRAGIATLVRLLYFPQIQTRSSALYKVLVHLAENGKTRGELLSQLLMVLAEGTASIHAVDRSFAHMSSKAARATSTPQRGTPRRPAPGTPQAPSTPTAPATPHAERAVAPLSHVGDEAPYLIAARTLETLMHLVQANEQAAAFFLCEETRGKKRPRDARSPIHTLLALLEKDVILANAQLVDALIALLNAITKPLAGAQPAPADAAGVAVLAAPLAGAEVLPIAPERLAAVVRPLRTAISSRGFQHTLAVAAHLAHLHGARDVISDALQREANRASAALVGDLGALVASLPPAGEEAASERVHSAPLARLASPTSAQAQFLRCLRALDYLYMGK